MTYKVRRILITVLLCAAILLCGASFVNVFAKYVREGDGTGDIGGDSGYDLPYEVERAFTVESQEDLFNAIQYGYSHIQISENVKDPFIVTEDMATLNHSMILDVNGAEIQRNSRSPILTVGEGVTLTITDTSANRAGGLYNPVGSVLNVDGGALLVKEGKFESGPRYWEYYSNDTGVVDTTQPMITGERTVDGTTTNPQYPVLVPTVSTSANGKTSVDGNVYFDKACGSIPADTYCYYVSSDGLTSGSHVNFARGTADFVYTYYVTPDHKFKSVTKPTEGTLNEDYVQIQVYGYEKNFETATGIGETYPNYSAIKMLKGQLTIDVTPTKNGVAADYTPTDSEHLTAPKDMGSGCFISYYGLPQTACIYLAGGDMVVENAGAFVTADPANFLRLGAGELDRIDGEGNKVNLNASQGRGICILTSASNTGKLTVKKGVYRSYNLNCVQMAGGAIDIQGGYFQKRSTIDEAATGRAAVFVASGTCNVSNATFQISSQADKFLDAPTETGERVGYYGTNIYALYTTGGELNVTNSTLAIKGNYATALYSGGTGGRITLSGVTTEMKGNHLYGLYTLGGNVEMKDGTSWTLGEAAVGSKDATGAYSYAIYSDAAPEVIAQERLSQGTVTWTDGSVTIHGKNSRGIESHGQAEILSTNVNYNFEGSNSGAINISRGKLTVSGGSILMEGYNSSGIYSQGGDVLSQNVEYTLKAGKSFGIYATAGNITLHGGHMTMESRNQTYGILGVSSSETEGLTIDTFNTDIVVGGTLSASGEFVAATDTREVDATNKSETPACMGLFLANLVSNDECYISLYQCRIRSIDIGAGIRGGRLFMQSGTREEADSIIQTKNLSALAISGGNVYFGNVKQEYLNTQVGATGGAEGIKIENLIADEAKGVEVIEPSQTRLDKDGNEKNQSQWQDKFVTMDCPLGDGEKLTFNSPKPSLNADGKIVAETNPYPSYDGLYLSGGSLHAVDGINMTFKGRASEQEQGVDYVRSKIASYAIRVSIPKEDTSVTTVRLPKGLIQSSVGGGVFVDNGSEKACNVYLGTEDAEEDVSGKTNLAVITTGTAALEDVGEQTLYQNANGATPEIVLNNKKDQYGNKINKDDWQFKFTRDGGHAVRVNSGHLTVYGGYYRAASGNGVLVQGNDSKVVIQDGQFMGKDAYIIGSYDYKAFVGPAASYSLKQLGGTLTVNGGTFGGTYKENGQDITIANGVFLMGELGTTDITCTATFNAADIQATSRGIIIMQNCNVSLGRTAATMTSATDFKTKGSVYSVGLEPISEGSSSSVTATFGTITINSGIYDAHEDLPSNINWTNNYAFYRGGGGYTAGNGSYFHYGAHSNTVGNATASTKPITDANAASGSSGSVPTGTATSYVIVTNSSDPPNLSGLT